MTIYEIHAFNKSFFRSETLTRWTNLKEAEKELKFIVKLYADHYFQEFECASMDKYESKEYVISIVAQIVYEECNR